MKGSTGRKSFTECFSDFLGDPEGLTQEELDTELEAQGINLLILENRVAEIVKKGSEERRLSWRNRAVEKRAKIESLLSSKRLVIEGANLKDRIIEILGGGYGQEALSYAETYFRKRDSFSEKDLESLIEDLKDLNLLNGPDTKGK
jgi:hypothetical protein